jgi:hypothetical protein
MESLSNTSLAGINIEKIQGFSDLNFMQAASLTKAYLGGNVPLSFNLNLEVKNPNPTEANMAQFDWILSIDEIEMVSGTNEQEYLIPANDGTIIVPMQISLNLLEVLNDRTKDTLLNFGFNLADAGNKPTRVGLKLKPTVYVNSIPITYPGYIEIGTEFGAQGQ